MATKKKVKSIVEKISPYAMSTYASQIKQTIIQDDFAFEDFICDAMSDSGEESEELTHSQIDESRRLIEPLFEKLTVAIDKVIVEWYKEHTGKDIKLEDVEV